jgi:hypothetical protein
MSCLAESGPFQRPSQPVEAVSGPSYRQVNACVHDTMSHDTVVTTATAIAFDGGNTDRQALNIVIQEQLTHL